MSDKKSLPPIRVSSKTISNMLSAIESYNKKNLVAMTSADFRRLSYELLSQLILQGKELPIKISTE